MALTTTGLETQTEQEVLDSIIASEQELVSPTINVDDDTSLGQVNQIMANQIALTNEGIQDVYDQRDINKAEGKALDDNVSWLGITRQSAAPTFGEVNFTGDDNTTIVAGSLVQNDSTGDNYSVDATFSISSIAARAFNFKVLTLATGTYTVTIQGIDYDYAATVPTDTETIIIDALVALVDAVSGLSATTTGTGVDITAVVTVDANTDILAAVSSNQVISQVTSASIVTGVVTGSIPAPANTIVNILTPTGGWTSVNNPNQLTIGRAEETDAELRERAIGFTASTGTATVRAISSAVLQETGVASVAINEQFVSLGVGDTTVEVTVGDSGQTYEIELDGDFTANITSADAVPANIALQLVNNINGQSSEFYTATDNVDGTLTIAAPKLYKVDVVLSVTGSAEMEFDEGQHAGSIQLVIAGGSIPDDIAQTIYDTKPAGVEVWALPGGTLTSGTAEQYNGEPVTIEWNSPLSITMTTVTITFDIWDASLYPEDEDDAFSAIRESITTAGNSLGAGADVFAAELEFAVYAAVSGISNVVIEIVSGNGNSSSTVPAVGVSIASDEEALFINSASNIPIVSTPI